MLAAQRTSLLDRARAQAAALFPATITIDGQAYAVATSGLQRERDLMTGGWLDKPRVSFWIAVAAFAAAGKTVARPRDYVTWNETLYVITEAPLDATGAQLILRCEGPEQ